VRVAQVDQVEFDAADDVLLVAFDQLVLWLDGPLSRMKGFAPSPQELARRVAHTLGELMKASTKP
jgi:hypothetical protein